eukprot:CCRYP_006793-RA/>CCRYP_006793-RA protein AED:0.38 eAED:0.65 QI:0/0/0/1/0/0/2/0/320
MISTAIHGHHQDAAPYSTNQRQPGDRGAPGARTHCTLAPPCTITGATISTFQRHGPTATASQPPLNSSLPTATFPQNHLMKLRPALQPNSSSNSANTATQRTLANYPATNRPSRSSMTSTNSTFSNLRGWISLQHHLRGNPTAPCTLQQAPRLHNRITRHNTHGLSTSPTPPRRSPRLNPPVPTTPRSPAPPTPLQLPSPPATSHAPPDPAPPQAHSDHHNTSPTHPTFSDNDDDDDSVVIPIHWIPMDKHGPVHVQIQHFISQEALHAFVCNATSSPSSKWRQPTAIPHLEHFANPVIHPTTGKSISKYEELINDPILC